MNEELSDVLADLRTAREVGDTEQYDAILAELSTEDRLQLKYLMFIGVYGE